MRPPRMEIAFQTVGSAALMNTALVVLKRFHAGRCKIDATTSG